MSDLVNGMSLPEDYRINMCHLGMLFMMDWNKDGRFSLDDMQSFGKMSIKTIQDKGFKTHELSQQIQAHCTLEMWQTVCGSSAKEDDFVAWLSRVLQENEQFTYFDQNQEVAFVPQSTIKLLYEVLHVRETHNIEFQSFLALMQQTGEEMEVM